MVEFQGIIRAYRGNPLFGEANSLICIGILQVSGNALIIETTQGTQVLLFVNYNGWLDSSVKLADIAKINWTTESGESGGYYLPGISTWNAPHEGSNSSFGLTSPAIPTSDQVQSMHIQLSPTLLDFYTVDQSPSFFDPCSVKIDLKTGQTEWVSATLWR
jgi:hypothetical protein